MTWYVVRRKPDGTIIRIGCDEPSQVVSKFYDQETRGGDVWIENETGRKIETKSFNA